MSEIYDTATVTVTEPVDGTVKRRRSGEPNKRQPRVDHTMVNREVWTTAQYLCREGQRIQIVSATEVLIVNT